MTAGVAGVASPELTQSCSCEPVTNSLQRLRWPPLLAQHTGERETWRVLGRSFAADTGVAETPRVG